VLKSSISRDFYFKSTHFPDVPVLLDTTFEILAQSLFNEDPDRVHQDAVRHSSIEQEQTQQELHQLQQELNAKFVHQKAFGEAQGASCSKCCACAVSG